MIERGLYTVDQIERIGGAAGVVGEPLERLVLEMEIAAEWRERGLREPERPTVPALKKRWAAGVTAAERLVALLEDDHDLINRLIERFPGGEADMSTLRWLLVEMSDAMKDPEPSEVDPPPPAGGATEQTAEASPEQLDERPQSPRAIAMAAIVANRRKELKAAGVDFDAEGNEDAPADAGRPVYPVAIVEYQWIDAVATAWRRATGAYGTFTVPSDGSGGVGGKFLEFLKIAAEPIGIKNDGESWRKAFRNMKDGKKGRTKRCRD